MQLILITGLDGSGKSSLLSQIASQALPNNIGFIHLPFITVEYLQADSQLYAAANCVNAINRLADQTKQPSFKALALFAAMLLYRPVLQHTQQNNPRIVFCERHPLIDTPVYALFYIPKLLPQAFATNTLAALQDQYSNEIAYICDLIPSQFITNEPRDIRTFTKFMFRWFYQEQHTTAAHYLSLFDTELPNKIYFLDAQPETLIKRLESRAVSEAHETLATLSQLRDTYNYLFNQLAQTNPELVVKVDAERIENLNLFFEQLKTQYNL